MNTLRKFSAIHLAIILGVVYVLQVIIGFEPGFRAGVSPEWKFLTSFFGHSDMEHLYNNLFFITLFGTIYRLLTSEKIFWGTFIVSALFANTTAFIFYPDSYIIGASGGAMGLLSALAVYKPRKIGLALGVPAPMYAVLVVYILINFAGITGSSTVAYEAHLFGLVTGFVIGIWLREREDEEEKAGKKADKESDNWEDKIRNWEQKYMLD